MDVKAAIEAADVDALRKLLAIDPWLANTPLSTDDTGTTPLNAAARLSATEIALLLLDAGARIDDRGAFGETPLHWAASTGNVTLVRRLLDLGARTDLKDTRSKATPLGWARHALANTPREGLDDVIAALDPQTTESTLSYILRHAKWAALASVIAAVPVALAGYTFKADDALAVITMLAGLAFMAALAAAALSIPFLFLAKARRRALGVFSSAGTFIVILMVAITFSAERREDGFALAAERAEPLISAIEVHVRDTGGPPSTLQELVPRYLPAIPDGLPALEIVTGDTVQVMFDGNDWILKASAATGLVNFDQFLYYPNQQYPTTGYGVRVERFGRWAYIQYRPE